MDEHATAFAIIALYDGGVSKLKAFGLLAVWGTIGCD